LEKIDLYLEPAGFQKIPPATQNIVWAEEAGLAGSGSISSIEINYILEWCSGYK